MTAISLGGCITPSLENLNWKKGTPLHHSRILSYILRIAVVLVLTLTTLACLRSYAPATRTVEISAPFPYTISYRSNEGLYISCDPTTSALSVWSNRRVLMKGYATQTLPCDFFRDSEDELDDVPVNYELVERGRQGKGEYVLYAYTVRQSVNTQIIVRLPGGAGYITFTSEQPPESVRDSFLKIVDYGPIH